MPTIDIDAQRNSGGIGNAWDFFDRQRVLHASARWSLVTGGHTLQSGVEYRRMRLDRRIHVAHQRRSRLRQLGVLLHRSWRFRWRIRISIRVIRAAPSARRTPACFIQDDWKIGRGLTLNAGLRYDVFGMLTEKNGRMGQLLPARRRRGTWREARFLRAVERAVVPARIRSAQHRSLRGARHAGQYEFRSPHAPNDSTLRGDYNNVAPRIGLAWQPTFAPRFVIRGGWGFVLRAPLGWIQESICSVPRRSSSIRTCRRRSIWQTRIRS